VGAPLSQPGAQWERIPDLNIQLISAVREKNLVAVRQLVVQKADANHVENHPSRRTPLQHALEVGGDIDTVNLLLQAKSDPNVVMASGMTAVHHAIEQYMHVPPIVIRMLLCAKGDLNGIVNSKNMTALDIAKVVARSSFASPGSGDADVRVRQLLNEVTEQATVAVSVVDSSEVLNVVFADTSNDNIAYYTDSALYLYSLKSQRVVFLKKLRQTSCRSIVRHVAVNPELGTIAVCLEILQDSSNGEAIQNVSIVWPNGQLTDEEPLKLSTPFTDGPHPGALPPCVTLSRCRGPQVLVCRFSSREVFCWRLNAARSQLVHESKLLSCGGHIATSDDGLWIAVENKEIEDGEGQIGVWCHETLDEMPRPPKLIHTLYKRPVAMTVMQQDRQSCCLAIVEHHGPGQPLPPIEIFSIALGAPPERQCSNIYRIRLAAPCLSLKFCHATPTHLLSGHEDGLVVVYDLPTGVISLSHDGPGTRAISISSDRTLIASAENSYVRVYKVPQYEDP
jgi:ankyrin repeat protein